MPPITDPAMLAEIQRQQAAAPPNPMGPTEPYYTPKPMTFPGARSVIPRMSLPPGLVNSTARQDAMLPSQASKSEADAGIAQLNLRKLRMEQGLDPETGKALANSGMVGNQAISDLSEGEQDMVKGITQGRVPVTSLAMAKNPQLYKLVQRAFQYEPGTDLTTFARRQAAFQKFMSNPNSPMVRVNQALQHLDRFAGNAKKLENAHTGFFTNPLNIDNYARASYLAMQKDPRYQAFATDRDALSTELAAAFQGSGQSALADREHWKSILSAANSPEAFDATIKEAVGLLGGRVDASNAQFKQAVGANAEFYDLMSPEARKVYQKFAPDAPMTDEGTKTLSTETKAGKLPEGYLENHAALVGKYAPGTMTVQDYMLIRKHLADEHGGWGQGLDLKDAQAVVDFYNKTGKVPRPVADDVPLEGREKANAETSSSPLGTGVANFTNAATLGAVDLVTGQEGRDKLALASEANPIASTVGEVAGSLAPMAGIERGGLAVLKKLAPGMSEKQLEALSSKYFSREAANSARKRLGVDVATNMTYGGARGASGADEGEGVEGALAGAGAGALAAGVGNVATKGLTPLLADKTISAIDKLKGVKLTTLQRLGLGKLEEAGTSIPLTHGARLSSLKSYNINDANTALKYINKKVPKGVEPGTDLNAYVDEQLSQSYNEIRPLIVGSEDGHYIDSLIALKALATTPDKKAMWSEISDALKMFSDEHGHYTGQGYKEATARLRSLVKDYSTAAERDGSVAARDMARAAEQARKQMQTLVQRQTPAVGARLKNIERGWAHKMRNEDASNRALTANEGSVYSPNNKLMAVKKFDTSVNKGSTARGKAYGQPEAEAAAKIMGGGNAPKLSLRDTGYAAVLLGAGGGASVWGGASAATVSAFIGAAAAGLYGPGVKRITQAALSGKRPTAFDNALVRRSLEDFIRHKSTGN